SRPAYYKLGRWGNKKELGEVRRFKKSTRSRNRICAIPTPNSRSCATMDVPAPKNLPRHRRTAVQRSQGSASRDGTARMILSHFHPDVWRRGSLDPIDVPLRIALVEVGDHLLGSFVEGIGEADLRCRLQQTRLRLSNRRKSLIQVVRHLCEVVALFRPGRKPECDANLVNALQRFIDACLPHEDRFVALFEFLL